MVASLCWRAELRKQWAEERKAAALQQQQKQAAREAALARGAERRRIRKELYSQEQRLRQDALQHEQRTVKVSPFDSMQSLALRGIMPSAGWSTTSDGQKS